MPPVVEVVGGRGTGVTGTGAGSGGDGRHLGIDIPPQAIARMMYTTT